MTACGNADKQNTQQAENDESAEPIYLIEPQLTQDDIPELGIDASFSMYHILTFHDGDNYSGAMGFYHDYIYSIENGKWVYVTGGEYYDKYDDEQWAYDFTYRWEDEEVTEAVYEQKLRKVFDKEQSMEPENFVSLEEMLLLFQM